VLEPVTRPSSGEPHVLEFRMPVDQEVAIAGVLILANLGLLERRIREIWKLLLEKRTRSRDLLLGQCYGVI